MISAVREAVDGWLARAERRPAAWLGVCALLLALQLGGLWYPTPDGLAYLSIARRMAAGGPLARLGDPQLGFPLGYPLLISPAFLAGARPFLLLAVIHWLMAVTFMLGLYRWSRRVVETGAVWVTALVMVNVNIWNLYRCTLSEAAFLAVMIWTVNALDDVLLRARAAATARRAPANLLAAAVLLVALTAIREVGALFAAGFAAALLVRVPRDAAAWRRAALPLLVTGIAVLVAAPLVRPERLAAAGPALAGHLAGYADAGAAVTSLGERLHLRMTEIGQLLEPGMFKAYDRGWLEVNTLVYAPLFAVVAAGWWMLIRRRVDVFACTAPLYLGLHLAWPYAAGTRYLLPLLPLFVACLWDAWALLRPVRRIVFALALLAHLGVAIGYWLAIDGPRARACDRQWPALEQLGAVVTRDAGPVWVADVPSCVSLMLEFLLDRPVQRADGEGAGAGARWILAPVGTPPARGLMVIAAAGDYALFESAPRVSR